MDTSQKICKCNCSCLCSWITAVATVLLTFATWLIAISGLPSLNKNLDHTVQVLTNQIKDQKSKKPDLKLPNIKQTIENAFPEGGQIYIPSNKLEKVVDEISKEKSLETRREILKRNLKYNFE